MFLPAAHHSAPGVAQIPKAICATLYRSLSYHDSFSINSVSFHKVTMSLTIYLQITYCCNMSCCAMLSTR